MFLRAKITNQSELLSWIQRYYAHDHIAFNEGKIGAAVAPLLADDTYGAAYFVQVEGKTVGYFIFTLGFDIEYGGPHATVTDLYFGEEARRSGVGSKTMKFIEQLCRDRQLQTLFLQVEIDNVRAQGFYKKMGFDLHTRYTMTKAID